ncbi:MAG TPA: hypothetical protein VLH94_02255 [Spirochaetia bacterium]|nr:hypothetical protein [Spirochaetia bacterium]
MIKLNLISKKRRAYSGRNWTKIISFSLFGLFVAYFVGVTLYVVISLGVLNRKVISIDKESIDISNVMLNNNDKLSRFVLTKLILTQIENINKTRFHYKDYLDQISLLLPQNVVLSKVDFKTKGWISVAISADDVFSFQALEKSILEKDVWSKSLYFSGAYIEGVSKDKNGSYTVNMQLELKENG